MKTRTKLLLGALLMLLCMVATAQTKTVNQAAAKAIETGSKNTGSAIKQVYGDTKDIVKTVHEDGKSVAATIHDDFKQATEYVTPKVVSLLEKVAQKLETTTDAAWQMLVDQQRVKSWTYLIIFILAIISCCNFYYRYTKYTEKNKDNPKGWPWSHIIIVSVVGLIATSLTFTAAPNLYTMMTGFINPEYGAVKDIIEIAQTLKNNG